jgi:uncharacterized protein (TIGR02145 family)
MKNTINITLLYFAFVWCGNAQQVSQKVGTNPTLIHPSAALEVESTNKGFLPPRMTNAQMTAIVAPTTGLIVYCTNCNPAGLWVYNGTAWASGGTGGGNPTVTADCTINGFVGAYISGFPLSGASFSTTLTNNAFSSATISFAASDVLLSGVSGLTVGTPTPASATLNAGQSQLVSYPITGTPAATGTLTGSWSNLALSCFDTQTIGGIAAGLNNPSYCTNAALNGIYVSGVAFTSSNTFTVTITNNSSGNINGLPAPATSNLALSWTGTGSLSVASVTPTVAYNLANGATRTFTYTLSGTPTSVGTLTTNWTYSDLSCQKVQNIGLGDATFTLPQSKYATSIYDGTPIVDIQGYITNTAPNQFIINVPYTGGLGNYPAYTSSVVTSTSGQGGDVNGFTISYPAGTFAASGTIPVTVTVDGDGSYAAKKQLFGIQETIATLPFVSNGTNKGNILLGVVGGIPDRAFGQTINGANNHNFVYLPVVGADGKTWLNHNLGAHYSNINHASFNPAQQATSISDHLAYGSLFQWGRAADGHELITYTSGTLGTPVNGTTSTLSGTDTPAHKWFITTSSGNYDWRTPQNNNLWQGVSGTNNPCPVGYRLPTNAELTTLVTTSSITSSATAASSTLKLTLPGNRSSSDGSLSSVGINGYYWSSSVGGTSASIRYFSSGGTFTFIDLRANGWSVRCLKD